MEIADSTQMCLKSYIREVVARIGDYAGALFLAFFKIGDQRDEIVDEIVWNGYRQVILLNFPSFRCFL